MYLPPSRPCCHGRSLNRPWLKRRRSLNRKNLTISLCLTSDTVACVSSRRSCSRILNSMPRRPRPSCCRLACKAREKTLPDVTLADGDLRIAPLRKNTPESAEGFGEKAYALMPHVKITELLAEVDQWTSLGDRFLHLRTQTP